MHEYLSKDPAYICKCCHATVTKYANLKPCIDEISANMMSTLILETASEKEA